MVRRKDPARPIFDPLPGLDLAGKYIRKTFDRRDFHIGSEHSPFKTP
jgi:hypothetical protein